MKLYGEDGFKRVVNKYVSDALKEDNGIRGKKTDTYDDLMRKQANYAEFILRVFARDLLANLR